MIPSVAQVEAYIRQAAIARGIDPDVAVRVARTEGLGEGIWQSNVMLDYGRERSYGPFQLHVAPEGRRPGLGNAFKAKTGLDPADPSTWRQGVDFALDNAATGGWGPWFGAKKIGITGKMGIGEGEPQGVSAYAAPEREDRGGAYNSGYGTAAPAGLLDEEMPLAPTATGKDAYAELGKLGAKTLKSAMDTKDEDEPLPQAQVLQPMRRIKLGKGLLG